MFYLSFIEFYKLSLFWISCKQHRKKQQKTGKALSILLLFTFKGPTFWNQGSQIYNQVFELCFV